MTSWERFRFWLFRRLFAAEYQRHQNNIARLYACEAAANAPGQREMFAPPEWIRDHAAVQAVKRLGRVVQKQQEELTRLRQPRAARFKLEGGMEREQIEEQLAGHSGMPAIKAVQALLANKVIELSDRATDAPHGAYATAEGAVPAFGNDERLHFAGGANTAAELLADLQELVKPRPEAPKKEAGA